MEHITVGVDVSKAHLDAHLAPEGRAERFTNDRDGIRRLVEWIGDAPVRCVAYEPTGRWHRPLEAALLRAGLPAAAANPLRARRFAEAIGQQAKTDPVDAAMLAAMAAAVELRPAEPADAALDGLRELVLAREQLVKDRTATRNRLNEASHPLLRTQLKRRLKQVRGQIKAVDAAIRAALAADPALARRAEVLVSIPGVSQATAACLVAEVPELGSLSHKAIACLVGLAPFANQSGGRDGKRSIRGGRARPRSALHMPALVAVRHNPDLKVRYDRLRAAGKPHKVALTAVMRSLLQLANALLAQDRLWAEKAPRQAAA